MATERTLSIIKPDGLEKGIIGKIVTRFEEKGLKPVAVRMQYLSQRDAEGFYAVHKARPFFKDLVTFMTSGPVVLMVLEGENAIAKNREVMGATDRDRLLLPRHRDHALHVETVVGQIPPQVWVPWAFFRHSVVCGEGWGNSRSCTRRTCTRRATGRARRPVPARACPRTRPSTALRVLRFPPG